MIDSTEIEQYRENNCIDVKKVLGVLPNVFCVWRDHIWVRTASAEQLEPEGNWDAVRKYSDKCLEEKY